MSATQIQNAFEQFANFGSSKPQLNEVTTMDNAHFAKMCRDAHITDKSCTSVDVDIIFKKVLTKGERRITFQQFKEALELLAQKKFPKNSQATARVTELIIRSQPAANATQADANGIFSKLTDASLYTGTHKLRFDENGNGRGKEGRDDITKTADLSQIVERKGASFKPSSANGKRGPTSSMDQLSQNKGLTITNSKGNLASTQAKKPVASKIGGSSNSLAGKSNNNLAAAKSTSSSSGSVYDRLTDTKSYTGSHKHRFDSEGKGRGLAGRETGGMGAGTHGIYNGGNVHSISQILRK